MRRLAVLLAGVACGGAAPTSSSSSSGPAGRSVTTPDEPLPALTLPLLDGGSWSSGSARGKVLVIDVWASWCKPCREGFPKMDALARRHPEARFVALSIDEEREAIDRFLAQVPTRGTVVHDRAQQVLGAPLEVTNIPTVLVIDRAGMIRHRFVEPSASDYERLDEAIGALIAAP
jgi:thiol-disulfide isomerase/thioredoxin